MSSNDIERLIKEQRKVVDFETNVAEAMAYIKSRKQLRVYEKVAIIHELRILAVDTWYGFHIVNGELRRIPFESVGKQYDNRSTNDPMKIAVELEKRAVLTRTTATS